MNGPTIDPPPTTNELMILDEQHRLGEPLMFRGELITGEDKKLIDSAWYEMKKDQVADQQERLGLPESLAAETFCRFCNARSYTDPCQECASANRAEREGYQGR